MNNDILQCINTRIDFFEKYYFVPDNVRHEVDDFIKEMQSVGEQSTDAQDFETKFATNGLQERFTAILMKCTPKQYNMTAEEKAASRETAKEIFKEDRSRIIKETVEDVIDHVAVESEEELIALRRKAMIEADVYDDYTKATNAIDIAKSAGGLLKGLFKKKK